jgi:hypothetical protein
MCGVKGPMRRGLNAKIAAAGPWRRGPANAAAAMRVRTGSTSSTTDLAGYLRRCDCLVEFVDDWTLEVGVRPGSLSERHARIELDAYIRVWQAMNPAAAVERIEPRPAGSKRN